MPASQGIALPAMDTLEQDSRRPASILPLRLLGAVAKVRGKVLAGPVDLEIERHGFTIVMGPNGAGKTTLLRLMHGLQRLSGGELLWNLPPALARKRQAFVFQSPVMMRRSVIDNIARMTPSASRKAIS